MVRPRAVFSAIVFTLFIVAAAFIRSVNRNVDMHDDDTDDLTWTAALMSLTNDSQGEASNDLSWTAASMTSTNTTQTEAIIVERQQIQEIRLDSVNQRCSELNDNSRKQPKWSAMSVNRERRVLMCLVGKAAGTTWMRVLLRLTGNPDAVKLANSGRFALHGNAGRYITRMHHVNSSMRAHYLNSSDYYRVMFVREPLERLISGYRDKMFRAPDYVSMRQRIKHMFRASADPRSEEFKKSVTFPEFVRYVLWELDNKPQVDEHWRTQYDVCRPCHIRYDYLGYYETMQDDAKDLFRTVAAGSTIEFPEGDFDSKLPNSSEYLKLFQDVPVSDIRRILAFYENDYKVFGYDIPELIRRRLDLGDETQRKSTVVVQSPLFDH